MKTDATYFDLLDTPLGEAFVAVRETKVCAVSFGSELEGIEALFRGGGANGLTRSASPCREAAAALIATLENPTIPCPLEMHLEGTEFQRTIWDLLREIPLGETRTYSELAAAAGRPRAIRAAAAACAANRVAVWVPCHRVIGKSGSLTGYRWGCDRKRRLLESEAPLRAA